MPSPLGAHVTHILLAEFDIDKGSSLAHQYPEATGTDEHLLAELMLPDGAHLRTEDWTVFFLNQTIPDPDKISIDNDTNSGVHGRLNDDNNETPLLYALNLVRTKHVKEARRGAIVKAMAICTRHQYLHIYKPVLLIALENYFQNPSVECLASLYESVNSMNVTNMPKFSTHEKAILRASENKDMFEEKFDYENCKKQQDNENTGKGLGIVNNAEGGEAGTDNATSDDANFKRATYVDLIPNLNKNKDRHFYETKVEYGIKLPIRVPLTVNPEEVGDFSLIKLITTFSPSSPQPFNHAFHPHLDSSGNQTHPIILLLNALLTQKRIIFLGQGHPSGDVANYVLSACAMGSGSGGVLRGFTERAFPYTNLTNVDDLLKVPGFIAGVTNRIFEDHSSWWDVLCNIDTGKITVSKDIATPSYGTKPDERPEDGSRSPSSSKTESWGREKWDTTDNEFMAEVMHAIQHHYGETTIRGKFQEYVQRFVRLTALYEIEAFGSTKIGMMAQDTDHGDILGTGLAFQDENSKLREVAANVNRIEGWRQTISYKYYQLDFQNYLKVRSIKAIDVYHQVAKLKNLKNMPEEEVECLYKAFVTNVLTNEQIIEFLSYLPQNQGGLFPIGLGLFYPLKTVRSYTIELFNRINNHTLANQKEKEQQNKLAMQKHQQMQMQEETVNDVYNVVVDDVEDDDANDENESDIG
ncbi:2611_t:CDS:10, partial [Funneliformis caledonium]